MKKILKKKLMLSKATVANLDRTEMNGIIGASVVYICTESCSIVYFCCTPTKVYELQVQENGIG